MKPLNNKDNKMIGIARYPSILTMNSFSSKNKKILNFISYQRGRGMAQ
jgi:hypothetical protein